MTELPAKMSNTACAEPCTLCGERVDVPVGPAVFLAPSWAPVCDRCAQVHAPALLEVLRDYRRLTQPTGEAPF